jgi:phosphatidylserine/phosphatidylglycerophosphate/cardiolipin synthase-like enzyme
MDDLSRAIEEAARVLPRSQVLMLAAEFERVPNPNPATSPRFVRLVPTPAFQEHTQRLLAAWSASRSALAGSAVALALRAAVRSVEAERESEDIEIVWTGPSSGEVPVRLTREALIDVIRAARDSLIVVSFAAYKVDLVLNELRAAVERKVDVSLVLETSETGGGTLTFDASHAFESLRGAASFYEWPEAKRPALEKGRASLHAKAAIADDDTAFVTSANLTGLAITSNMELGLLIRGGPVPRRLSAHFKQLIFDQVLDRVLG